MIALLPDGIMDVGVFELQTVLEMQVRCEGICVIETLQITEDIERSRMEQFQFLLCVAIESHQAQSGVSMPTILRSR